jgi:hypothetical protein
LKNYLEGREKELEQVGRNWQKKENRERKREKERRKSTKLSR